MKTYGMIFVMTIVVLIVSGFTFAVEDLKEVPAIVVDNSEQSATEDVLQEASENPLSVAVTMDWVSRYIWRGQMVSHSVFQPEVAVGYAGFSASVWGNMELSKYNGQRGDINEYDYALEYGQTLLGPLNGSVGVIHYSLHGTDAPSTTEVFWGLGLDTFLNPEVKFFHDVEEVEGATYATFGVSHSLDELFKLGDLPVGLDISATLGWGSGSYNEYYWGTGKQDKVNDLMLSVGFPFEVCGWTVTPSVNYSTLLDHDIRETDAYSKKSDFLFAGISIGKEF